MERDFEFAELVNYFYLFKKIGLEIKILDKNVLNINFEIHLQRRLEKTIEFIRTKSNKIPH